MPITDHKLLTVVIMMMAVTEKVRNSINKL